MDLRLLAGVFCGSALTIALASIAGPRPQSSCTQVADVNTRLDAIEKNIATLSSISSEVSTLEAASTANAKWQADTTKKLDEINLNLLNFQYNESLRR